MLVKTMIAKSLGLILLLLCLWIGCRNTDTIAVRHTAILEKLPPSLLQTADSLLNLEARLVQMEVYPFVLEGIQMQIGRLLVERAPEESVVYFDKVLAYYYENDQLEGACNLHLFMAQVYDQKLQKPEQALEHLFNAEALAKEIDDVFKRVNILRYEGLMEAELGRIEEGIQKVKEATEYFWENDNEDDVISSFYDLAQIAYLAGEPKEGLNYLDEAMKSWKEWKAYGQIILANNLRLRLLMQDGQLEEAMRIYTENDSLIRSFELHWLPRLSFLQVSRELLQESGQDTAFSIVEEEYRKLTDSLDAERLVYFEE